MNLTIRSFIASLTSIVTVILMGVPAVKARYGFMAQSKLLYTLALFLTLFFAHAIIDLLLKTPNKGCHLFDSLMLAIFGLMGYGIYEGVKRLPLISGMLRGNVVLDLIMAGIFVAIPVFIWKRGFRMLIIGKAC